MELSKNCEQGNNHLEEYLQNFLENKVEEKYLREFTISLFPCSGQNLYSSLLENMRTYYLIKITKNITFEEITQDINKKSEEIGHGLPQLMKQLFESDFSQKFRAKLSETKESKKGVGKEAREERKGNEVVVSSKEERKINEVVVNNKPKDLPKAPRTQTGSSKSNNSRQENKRTQPLNPETDYVNNLMDRGVCLCEKVVGSHEGSFQCVHCKYYYHLECMRKKEGTRYCSMCHLRRMLPNRAVQKVLFLGVLKKSKKKHEFTIYLSDEDLSMKHRLQVRSIRLKDATQYFVQFPDYTNIVLNNASVKEFQPLHRQSSLKYRKDEPFTAELKHLLLKENKVVIHEKLPSKENKEDRIDVENHLIGFFMVEERKIDPLVKEISATALTTFEESKSILDVGFKGSEDLSCEVVKIPLLCTLSTERIKTPARGLFCSHYQCFDLHNYMIITSASANPKWICPLCKMPCYEFKVDCILQAILGVYAEEKGTEVMFFKSGEFSVHAGDKHIEGKINSIKDLPIETSARRPAEPPAEPERRRRKPLVIPENTNVISLD